MQPIARDGLTASQVVDVVEAADLEVDAGADLLDPSGTVVDDLTPDLIVDGSQVEYGSYRTIHRRCRLKVSRELAWTSVRVRPWMRLTDRRTGATFRANLGVFLLETPERTGGETPATWTVDGYDLLSALDSPAGKTHRADAGVRIDTAVTAAVVESGLSVPVMLAASGDLPVLPRDRVWPIGGGGEDGASDGASWLGIVNGLLSSAGYRAVRADADGTLRSQPYQPPADRPSEWTYNATAPRTIVGERSSVTEDTFDVPNRWVFLLDDPDQDTPPTEGDGIHTVVNQSDGPTSIDGRGGIVRSRVVKLDAADQPSLVAQADRIVAADRTPSRELEVTVGPNPLHGHFDIVTVVAPDVGVSGKWQVSDWTLPLDGTDMTLTASPA